MLKKEIRVKHQCDSCQGTGLYSGRGESEHAAVVCSRCKGQGWQESVFTPFQGRKERPGTQRVYQANPGIKIGEGNGHRLEDFGGMPHADWVAGLPFPQGSEMRRFSCPRWWGQVAGGHLVDWDDCARSLGRSFSQCPGFCDKAKCWERFDAETR